MDRSIFFEKSIFFLSDFFMRQLAALPFTVPLENKQTLIHFQATDEKIRAQRKTKQTGTILLI